MEGLLALVFVKKLTQVGRCFFEIVWSDGKVQTFNLAQLQNSCPCISCFEKQKNPSDLEEVSATKVVNVGSYALRINFTSGCSRGIFTFSFLRSFGGNNEKNMS